MNDKVKKILSKYKIDESNFVAVLLQLDVEISDNIAKLNSAMDELITVLSEQQPSIIKRDLVRELQVFKVEAKNILTELAAIKRENSQKISAEIAQFVNSETVNRLLRNSLNAVILGYLGVAGLMLMMTGYYFGRMGLFGDAEVHRQYVAGRAAKQKLDFLEKNPHLLDCSGRGWTRHRRTCIPTPYSPGYVRGWTLP